MRSCPYCQYENREAAIYCERCEALLQRAALANLVNQLSVNSSNQPDRGDLVEVDYAPTSYVPQETGPLEVTTSLLHDTNAQYRLEYYERRYARREQTQTTSEWSNVLFLRNIFYFVIALPATLFGLYFVFFAPTNPPENDPVGGSMAMGLFLVVYAGGGVVFYRRRMKRRKLSLGGFLTGIFSTVLLTLLALSLVTLFLPMVPPHVQEIIFCLVILCAGLGFCWIALY
jgi:hypothetical protein